DWSVTGVQTCALPIWERVSDLLELPPDPRHETHHHHERAGDLDHVLQKVLHGAAAVAVRDQLPEPGLMPRSRGAPVDVHERRLEIGRASCRERGWNAG